ncbi:CsbD family protein [Corynebacterium antarcticum]|uniref:CsbD family protein n=1 Tax=Corynebacterium antarcticum TaxID=2800405 RepID=A0A9Q4CBM3_9CORY|nr:CsbD family protein [Corynebacterium antarcticum]MCK7642552.1 CsbD family protein [Corynebacterium antarcticum]MCK7660763.1 CsbD family protein [Corynebacterium antarcticum]MCX7492036.1 CsbD family protein [Corynebacterium antarcticum]MCX7537915.1 CsbD family protein [Corynebacterium antarcticum]
MGFESKANDLGGKIKEGVGEATDNENLANEGRADQVKSDIKEGVEKAEEAVRDAADKVKDIFDKK